MVRRYWWIILVLIFTACANPTVQGTISIPDQITEEVVEPGTEEPITSLGKENQSPGESDLIIAQPQHNSI
jgi:hypothetical protein